MRAAVLSNRGFNLEDRGQPTPATGEVLIRTVVCGICGSDLHRFHEATSHDGSSTDSRPLVLGHEFCGELIDYGPDTVRTINPGKLVVSFPAIQTASGVEIVGFSERYPGGFAERMLLQADLMVEVPNGLSADLAALTEPMAVGEHAVARANMNAGDVAMVVGCGPVGLAVIAALRSRGLGPIVGVDFSAERRAIAEKLGADLLIDPAEVSPYSCWPDFGIDPLAQIAMHAYAMKEAVRRSVIFECVGAPGLIADVVKGAPIGATIVVAGACNAEDRFHPLSALVKEVELRFSNAYSLVEFARTLHRIAEGDLDVAPLITKTVELDQVQDAFEALSHPSDAKILLRHRS